MRDSFTKKIKNRIDTLGEGAVFIANDFPEIADYETVRRALNRMVDAGVIQRILRGVYYSTHFNDFLQEHMVPDPHLVALAIARKFNWSIAPAGTTALNMLGLSTQVPAAYFYVSNGPYNSFECGNIKIEFVHRSPRELTGMSDKTALIIQGIRALGKGKVSRADVAKIRSKLSESERQTLLKEAAVTTAWVYRIIKEVCGSEDCANTSEVI